MINIDYSELEMAFDFVSGATITMAAAYVSRKSGKIFWESSELDEELPSDIDESNLYVEVPSKQELNIGKHLALSFATENLSENYNTVANYFRKRGAYGRFKDLLETTGKLEAWYEYERGCVKEALCEWAKSEGFRVKG